MPKDDADEPKLDPPQPRRVVLRSFCLSAVTCRSYIDEHPDGANSKYVIERMRPWLEKTGAVSELEAWEAEVLAQPLGTLDMQTRINGTWLSEGLAVVGWALGRFDLPPHDVAVDLLELTNALQFLREDAHDLLASANVRSPNEIESGANRAFAIHWRIREFTLTRGQMNFLDFAKTAWFGPLNIEGVTLAESGPFDQRQAHQPRRRR